MNPLYAAALQVQEFFSSQHWRFCIIGGLAVIRWGEARTTQDVDVSLLTGFGSESTYIRKILERFEGRIPDAAAFALQSRVVLARAENGVGLDIALAASPLEEQVIQRATPFEYAPGVVLVTASAEDMIVLKAFAGRDQDWFDVRGILVRQQHHLKWGDILDALTGLCELEGNPEPRDRLVQLRREIDSENPEDTETDAQENPPAQ